ncbi:MarR family winged helix-turn-helix transcriptional regulator [Streptomyces sp. Qhu-G9]|uniref:MarR family winged helix-turn-helix transcriptional regulator n=1 Tax=Streptomyces sp. Qhu-G9 TaxID=3452799 RepID=UPI0022AC7DBB|nr:MarR family winged helix-turn-helix transcriptional regulator [Streptomyces aurantiacus]WAU79995.1 MarR family winged helix-turn-helix transcriptional regulator [Streptomyces aurantiacus]
MAASSDPADQPEHEPTGDSGLLPAELRSWMRLLAAAGAIEQLLRSRVKDVMGVSHDEFLVLCLLADQPGATLRMTRIAELLGRPKTRLTYQVACLQHAGLITKNAACGDRRGIEVALTDKARRLVSESTRPLADAVSQAIAQTACAQRYTQLHDLLPVPPDPDTEGHTPEKRA